MAVSTINRTPNLSQLISEFLSENDMSISTMSYDIRMSTSMIRKIIRGSSTPGIPTVAALAKVIPVDRLMAAYGADLLFHIALQEGN